ncbi:MAG: hypothetical protein ACLFVK_04035, partial [Dehalococcoidia bacterium]
MNKESGQTLPMALILVTLAMLLAAFVVPQFHVISRSYVSAEKDLMAYYAAEGAIDVVIAELSHGNNPIEEGYEAPNVTMNGYTPTITISRPNAGNAPDSEETHFDPNTSDPELEQLQPGNGYLLRLHDIHPGQMEINWAYTPAGLTKIGIWQSDTRSDPGKVLSWPDEDPVHTHESTSSNNHLSFTVSESGTYNVVFFNPLWEEQEGGGGIDWIEELIEGLEPILRLLQRFEAEDAASLLSVLLDDLREEGEETSGSEVRGRLAEIRALLSPPADPTRWRAIINRIEALERRLEANRGNEGGGERPNNEKTTTPFDDTTNQSSTWIYANSHRDYIIESTAGDVGIKAYV